MFGSKCGLSREILEREGKGPTLTLEACENLEVQEDSKPKKKKKKECWETGKLSHLQDPDCKERKPFLANCVDCWELKIKPGVTTDFLNAFIFVMDQCSVLVFQSRISSGSQDKRSYKDLKGPSKK